MKPKRSMRKMEMAEKVMEVFEPWKKAKIGFGVVSTGLDGVLFFVDVVPPLPIPSPWYIIYIQYNILYASTFGEI